jgi:hypothetical protein
MPCGQGLGCGLPHRTWPELQGAPLIALADVIMEGWNSDGFADGCFVTGADFFSLGNYLL